jgi:hypothetical protein
MPVEPQASSLASKMIMVKPTIPILSIPLLLAKVPGWNHREDYCVLRTTSGILVLVGSDQR